MGNNHFKKVVISCGPIPARLDSVKFITNRFKGGLAFETAEYLIKREKYDITIIKWEYTAIPLWDLPDNAHIVNVKDVYEYYRWFEENAVNYDAFIMAAAVANLSPVSPWENKFPSHLYKEGDTFDIKFQIAPRAIDIIKKLNPRCCLIGYKLFDAETDEELIAATEHTLRDSKANIIFANTPATAKHKKIALMQDGSHIKMDFEQHLFMITEAIDAEYFKTEVSPLTSDEKADVDVRHAFAIVEMFEKTFPNYGTVAVPVHRGSNITIATTARGHTGSPVLVRSVDMNTNTIHASGKATLNAATLWALMQERGKDGDVIIVHRHLGDERNNTSQEAKTTGYRFPGTTAEIRTVTLELGSRDDLTDLRIKGHGDYCIRKILPIDWNSYYEDFPDRYFGIPTATKSIIDQMRSNHEDEILEVGGNVKVDAKYAYDPYVKAENAINLTLEEVMARDFDLIVANNSINYLSANIITTLMQRTKRFVANSFGEPPEKKVTEREAVVRGAIAKTMRHALLLPNDDIVIHSFFAYTQADYENMGFSVMPYGKNSVWLSASPNN